MSIAADLGESLFYMLVFPGFVFLFGYAFVAEYADRKLYARLQNRVGPPLVQPFADFVKLLSKESIVPENAEETIFEAAPIVALAGVLTPILYVPVWSAEAALAFQGDLVVVLFLLTIPSFALIFGGWHSRNAFGQIGTVRTLTQLFGYEIPFFLACLAPAVAAGTWSISGIASFVASSPLYIPVFAVGFVVALLSLQAKLERIPFDVPEAETELVTGALVEYSGRKLALFRLTKNIELVVGAALLSALFLGGPYPAGAIAGAAGTAGTVGIAGAILGFAVFLVKTLVIVFALTILRAVLARFRIEQVVSVFYLWLVPLALAQLALVLVVGTAEVIP